MGWKELDIRIKKSIIGITSMFILSLIAGMFTLGSMIGFFVIGYIIGGTFVK